MTDTDRPQDFRIGVVGAGMMGADHVRRITSTISGARVSAIVDPDESRVAQALENAPGALGYSRIEDALAADALDGVLVATPGFLHEAVLLPCLEAGLPILCEKPLTPDPESSWRVLEAEQATGRHLIQVGFMRRFDPEYRQLRELVDSQEAGELLMLRCAHRNPSVPEAYQQESLINDSVVHEFDVVPLVGRFADRLPRGQARPPQSAHPGAPQGADPRPHGTCQRHPGRPRDERQHPVRLSGDHRGGLRLRDRPHRWHQGRSGVAEHADFTTRFATAYDTQVQAWVDAARVGTIAGPSAWDGYKVAVACREGVASLLEGGERRLDIPETPAFYR